MAVIELAKPGQEATTYELLVTVGNSALLVNGIVGTQMLTVFKGQACDTETCGDNTVDTSSKQAFDDSHGPERFRDYTLVLCAVSVTAVLLFVSFLPRSKEECHAWKEEGERLGRSETRGYITLAMVAVTVMVSFGFCVEFYFNCSAYFSHSTSLTILYFVSCLVTVRCYRGDPAAQRQHLLSGGGRRHGLLKRIGANRTHQNRGALHLTK